MIELRNTKTNTLTPEPPAVKTSAKHLPTSGLQKEAAHEAPARNGR